MSAGRKSKYNSVIEPAFEQITGWLRSGYTEASIAKRLGVAVSTWEKYKVTHEEFRNHLLEGRKDAGALVVNALFKRAIGYTFEETHAEVHSRTRGRGRGQIERQVAKKITRHVPADVAAMCIILFNRMADKWTNTKHIRHTGDIRTAGVMLTAPPMTRDEWLQLYEKNMKELPEPVDAELAGESVEVTTTEND